MTKSIVICDCCEKEIIEKRFRLNEKDFCYNCVTILASMIKDLEEPKKYMDQIRCLKRLLRAQEVNANVLIKEK